ASGSSAPDQLRAGRAVSSRTQARRGPMTNRARRQSRGPDGRPAQPLQGKMNKTVAPDRASAVPSSAASTEDRVRATESLFAQVSNRLLQQNRHTADIPAAPEFVCFWGR